MANLGAEFDAETVEPSAPRTILPAGKYLAEIVASEMRETKSGNGEFLALDMIILEGDQAGRHLFDNLNLQNPNADAVEIARRTLSAICHATGKLKVRDSDALHNIPMLVSVKVKPAGPDRQGIQREAQNLIGGYEPAPGGQRQVGQQAQRAGVPAARPAAPAAAKPASSSPPWKRSAA